MHDAMLGMGWMTTSVVAMLMATCSAEAWHVAPPVHHLPDEAAQLASKLSAMADVEREQGNVSICALSACTALLVVGSLSNQADCETWLACIVTLEYHQPVR